MTDPEQAVDREMREQIDEHADSDAETIVEDADRAGQPDGAAAAAGRATGLTGISACFTQ